MDQKPRIYRIKFATVYPMYVLKAEKRDRTKAEVDEVISWLTGYTAKEVKEQIEKQVDMETFFKEAPKLNLNRNQITGIICGLRVEVIEDIITQEIRYLDKLIDELYKG